MFTSRRFVMPALIGLTLILAACGESPFGPVLDSTPESGSLSQSIVRRSNAECSDEGTIRQNGCRRQNPASQGRAGGPYRAVLRSHYVVAY